MVPVLQLLHVGEASAARSDTRDFSLLWMSAPATVPFLQHVGAEAPHTSMATRTFFAHFGTNRTQGPNGDTVGGVE
jgi:hypothetical protein